MLERPAQLTRQRDELKRQYPGLAEGVIPSGPGRGHRRFRGLSKPTKNPPKSGVFEPFRRAYVPFGRGGMGDRPIAAAPTGGSRRERPGEPY
jgi:hypothetical protein